jgi:hypothetical protein
MSLPQCRCSSSCDTSVGRGSRSVSDIPSMAVGRGVHELGPGARATTTCVDARRSRSPVRRRPTPDLAPHKWRTGARENRGSASRESRSCEEQRAGVSASGRKARSPTAGRQPRPGSRHGSRVFVPECRAFHHTKKGVYPDPVNGEPMRGEDRCHGSLAGLHFHSPW